MLNRLAAGHRASCTSARHRRFRDEDTGQVCGCRLSQDRHRAKAPGLCGSLSLVMRLSEGVHPIDRPFLLGVLRGADMRPHARTTPNMFEHVRSPSSNTAERTEHPLLGCSMFGARYPSHKNVYVALDEEADATFEAGKAGHGFEDAQVRTTFRLVAGLAAIGWARPTLRVSQRPSLLKSTSLRPG
jgi:hypothetical protein